MGQMNLCPVMFVHCNTILVRLEFELKLEPLLLTSPAAATAAPAAALF